MRIKLLLRFLAFGLAVGAGCAHAWPERPIRIIVPFVAGGDSDASARAIAAPLSQALGQPVVVENRPGASTMLASSMVAKSPADGYTLLWAAAPHTTNPALQAKIPYDTVSDFSPIVRAVGAPVIFTVNASRSKAATLREYLDLADITPAEATVATAGIGTGAHLSLETLINDSGAKLLHVPYKGSAGAVNDLIGGQVSAGINGVRILVPHIAAGTLRPLAVIGSQRIGTLPEVPTMGEAGFPNVDASAWFGLVAPRGTPDAVIVRLNVEVNRILGSSEIQKSFEKDGLVAIGGTPEAFSSFIVEDIKRWRELVKVRNITMQ